jgi:hypothetical protein
MKQKSSQIEEEKHVNPPHKHSYSSKGRSKNDSSDDETFEEAPEQRAIPTFLQKIPGITVSPTDSLGYRIEALRLYLENMLGDVPFIAAYKHLIVT